MSDRQLGSLATAFVIVYMLASPALRRRSETGANGRGFSPRASRSGASRRRPEGSRGPSRRSSRRGPPSASARPPTEPSRRRCSRTSIPGSGAAASSRSSSPRSRSGRPPGTSWADWRTSSFGWRAAFGIAGLPGLALALLCLTLAGSGAGGDGRRRPHPDPLPAGRGGARQRRLEDLRQRCCAIGPTCSPWPATRPTRSRSAPWRSGCRRFSSGYAACRGRPPRSSSARSSSSRASSGPSRAAGWAICSCARSREAYLWVSGWATLAAAPATLVAFVAPQPAVYLPALVVAQLLVFASTGPINSVIVNVVAPTERARAVGLSILAIHLFGDVPSPPLVGAISDATSLQRAFLILPAAFAAGGAIWLYAAWKGKG